MKHVSRTIREQVTNQIRAEVVAGRFGPGEALRETDFAERFGVSRGPVRDAFLQLTQEGVLAYQANCGVTVRGPPEPESRALIVSLRQQVECFVVKRGMQHLDRNAMLHIDERLRELRAACETEDSAAVARADVAFHETMLTCCDGHEFLTIWKWLCLRMMITYTRLESYNEVYREHVDITAALYSGKKSAVTAALIANVQ